MKLFFRTLSFLPLWLLHAIGWFVGWLVFIFSGNYRREFLTNSRQAGLGFAKVVAGVGEAGKTAMEIPRLWMGKPVKVRWERAELIESALQSKKGVLFLTPHMGSFEITGQAYARTFGEKGHVITVLYRPARKTWMQDIVAKSRSRPGMNMEPATLAGVKQLARRLKEGGCVGMLPDQVPVMGMGVWAPFFGRNAYTMTLPGRLAQMTGATVLFVWGERLSWGRGYVVHVRSLRQAAIDANPSSAENINLAMQEIISEAPEQYLWGYERYKKPRDAF